MKPLAYRIRPKSFDDIVGQDHLVGKKGVITKMLENKTLFSMILYGPAGCGKTSIASIIESYYPMSSFSFNASVDSKAKLKEIAESTKFYENTVCIIDEIHRMKKDVQDFLLPYLENGSLILVGLTTENPYRSINPAIRSRCHIYRMNEINKKDIILLLEKTIKDEKLKEMSPSILEYIAKASSCEIRSALNMLEIANMLDKEDLSLDNVKELIGKKAFQIDEEGEYYYDVTSAMIKSIRGSDPNAALHYLARLLQTEDLEFITRRLLCLTYEDIGFGNPNIGPRVYAACQAALSLGLPEARLPLGYIVVDLATSPKSNSTYLAINEAIADLDDLTSMKIPPHILNKELKSGKYEYKYPHDYENDYCHQQYLPDVLKDKIYYRPKDTSSYERAIKEYLDFLNKLEDKKRD
ncbi:MAG: replication-associated recombination protein A [Acholeplasmatales bacterium]|nr:replication-associated recombination protein A [Acholeplasmatales bacterium]